MRITAGMLGEASLQAGMPLTGGSTLASYLDGDTSRTLASSLGESHYSTLNSLNKGKYEKQKDAAERLEEYADSLNSTGDKSIYEKARESGDTTELCDEVEKMISAYNGMLDKLRTDMTTMGRFYQSSLKEAVEENKSGLKELGISIDKNGRMTVDKEKLKAADVDRVESVFGAEGTLSSKLYLIAGKVADNAEANLKSISSQYNASGNSVDTLIRSYDAKR